jgi:hypothetical protein
MSATTIAIIAAALALIAILLVARGSGPRVTTIETRREDDDEDAKS